MNVARWLSAVARIQHPDEDVQRRGRNVIVLALGLLVLTVLAAVIAFFLPGGVASALTAVPIIVGMVGLLFLARRGAVNLAALLMITLITVTLFISSLVTGRIGVVSFFLLVSVMIAGISLRPWGVGVAMLLNLAAIAILAWRLGGTAQRPPLPAEVLGYGAVLCVCVGLIGALGSRSTERALKRAREARTQAEQNAAALDRANMSLAQQTAALQEALATQQQLNALVTELALPVIPIRADVLVIPLVGAIDSRRAADLRGRVLEQIASRQARAVIFDITGVPLVDAQVALALVQTARAARLLGARALLVGIRAEVAQMLVGLEIDLGMLDTQATLHEGLEYLVREGIA